MVTYSYRFPAGEASTSDETIPKSKADDQKRLENIKDDPNTVGPLPIPETGEACE